MTTSSLRHPIECINALDGRYNDKVNRLAVYFSEYALIRYRVIVELQWLVFCAQNRVSTRLSFDALQIAKLKAIPDHFTLEDALKVKFIEKTTNHDVKAVEYWLKEKMSALGFAAEQEWLHFACTSEDINNTAYALLIKDALARVWLPELGRVSEGLQQLALANRERVMLSRTHGQAASPTTMGKEIANFHARLARAKARVARVQILGKFNGAVGNFNAHHFAAPQLDWQGLAQDFLENSLGLTYNPMTTQIEPHDWIAELCDAMASVHAIGIGLARDMWGYISLAYFKQQTFANEVGSSVMPHKVNPIDFENAEGNFAMGLPMLRHFSDKLPISRFQRDLTDSTTLRNVGTAFAYGYLAMQALGKGISKLEPNYAAINADLEQSWEVLAEAIQTCMRFHGLESPYERLKAFTRGKTVDKQIIQSFIQALELPPQEKSRLLALTPSTYSGLAAELVSHYFATVKAKVK